MHFPSSQCFSHTISPRLHPFTRLASTSTRSNAHNHFPFPTTRNPTPHQIFHLPKTASQPEIKTRYFDLVKLYHPDAAHAHAVPPAQRTARFHAITRAYALLQRGEAPWDRPSMDEYMRAELRRRRPRRPPSRAYRAGAAPSWDEGPASAGSSGSGTWPSNPTLAVINVPLLLFLGGKAQAAAAFSPRDLRLFFRCVLTISAFVSIGGIVHAFSQTHARKARHQTAAANLAQARAEAQEFGMERRRQIRARVLEARADEAGRRNAGCVDGESRPGDGRS
ncbi:hypothetical protein HYDPIDRAFT_110422 [Hydnomerulius pinastri MD-312]|nr:hypothetical protein HYDPIDRAFT_110422 [Hydnomerulius pinastri MD-312]